MAEKSVRRYRMGVEEKDGYKRKVRASALCYLLAMRGEEVWAEGETEESQTGLWSGPGGQAPVKKIHGTGSPTTASEARPWPLKLAPTGILFSVKKAEGLSPSGFCHRAFQQVGACFQVELVYVHLDPQSSKQTSKQRAPCAIAVTPVFWPRGSHGSALLMTSTATDHHPHFLLCLSCYLRLLWTSSQEQLWDLFF